MCRCHRVTDGASHPRLAGLDEEETGAPFALSLTLPQPTWAGAGRAAGLLAGGGACQTPDYFPEARGPLGVLHPGWQASKLSTHVSRSSSSLALSPSDNRTGKGWGRSPCTPHVEPFCPPGLHSPAPICAASGSGQHPGPRLWVECSSLQASVSLPGSPPGLTC